MTDGTTSAQFALSPDPQQVRVARAFVVRTLVPVVGTEPVADDFLYDAATIASELVANAIRAGASLIRIELTVGADVARIAVIDDAAGEVQIGEVDSTALSGRGLRIIATLSRRWGVDANADGKAVWSELALPDPPAGRPERPGGTAMSDAPTPTPALRMTGDIDIASEAELRERAERHLATHRDTPDVAVDLGGVGFIDSRGMALLVRLHTEAVRRGGRLVVVAASPHAARSLHEHGLDTVFRIEPA